MSCKKITFNFDWFDTSYLASTYIGVNHSLLKYKNSTASLSEKSGFIF